MLLVNPQEGAAEIASLELAMIVHNLMVANFDHIILLVFKIPDVVVLKLLYQLQLDHFTLVNKDAPNARVT